MGLMILLFLSFLDENSAHLVELYLDVDITKFTEENKVTSKKDEVKHQTYYCTFK